MRVLNESLNAIVFATSEYQSLLSVTPEYSQYAGWTSSKS